MIYKTTFICSKIESVKKGFMYSFHPHQNENNWVLIWVWEMFSVLRQKVLLKLDRS